MDFGIPRERVHQILVGALKSLDTCGWSKGNWWSNDGGGCIMAHCGIAAGLARDNTNEIQNMVEGNACAMAMGFANAREAISWNDKIAMNKTEVHERLYRGVLLTQPPVQPVESDNWSLPADDEPAETEAIEIEVVDLTTDPELVLA